MLPAIISRITMYSAISLFSFLCVPTAKQVLIRFAYLGYPTA